MELEVPLGYRGVIPSSLFLWRFWLRTELSSGERNPEVAGDKGKEGEAGPTSEDASHMEKDKPAKEVEKEQPGRKEKTRPSWERVSHGVDGQGIRGPRKI